MGSEGWSPQPWSPDKSIAVLETKQVSPPSCQVPPSTLTLSLRRRADNGQQRATPGSPASGRSPDQPRPSLLPLGSCKGVQHAPPNPGPGQSPGTADHPRPTNPIPPSRLEGPPEVRVRERKRERRAASRRCRRNPEKSLKPSRGKTVDSRGSGESGQLRL